MNEVIEDARKHWMTGKTHLKGVSHSHGCLVSSVTLNMWRA